MHVSIKETTFFDRGMEQLVAREAHNLEVVGSSPTPATEKPSRNRRFFYFLTKPTRRFHSFFRESRLNLPLQRRRFRRGPLTLDGATLALYFFAATLKVVFAALDFFKKKFFRKIFPLSSLYIVKPKKSSRQFCGVFPTFVASPAPFGAVLSPFEV